MSELELRPPKNALFPQIVRDLRGPSSGRHLEEEIYGEKAKDGVGGPAGEQRWKLSNRAHGFKQCSRGPINDRNSDSQSQAADGAARSHQESERRAETHDDRGNQREREFLLPLHRETRSVESRMVKTEDVLAQLAPIHLIGLANFPAEIAGRFGDFRERLNLERRIACDLAAVIKVTDPATGENPGIFRWLPGGTRGEYASPDLKGVGIELEDAEAAEELLIGIEELVVVDFAFLAKYPLVRGLKISLRRAALDLVAQSVLALVGVGKEGIVQQKHGAGHDASR